MDDNCMPHRANMVDDIVFEKQTIRMKWPVYSSDMNQLKFVWGNLGRRTDGRLQYPHTLQELERTFLDE